MVISAFLREVEWYFFKDKGIKEKMCAYLLRFSFLEYFILHGISDMEMA